MNDEYQTRQFFESDGLLAQFRKQEKDTPKFNSFPEALAYHYQSLPEYHEPVIWMTAKQKQDYDKQWQSIST